MARGELHCRRKRARWYRQYIEKDPLERRFQKVIVDEPTVEDTVAILRGLKERLPNFTIMSKSPIRYRNTAYLTDTFQIVSYTR